MQRRVYIPVLFLILASLACEEGAVTPLALPYTQIPFFASETPPPFIIPVTDTPVPFIIPLTDTPFSQEDNSNPVVIGPPKWWDVYFTDPLQFGDSNNMTGSIEEKLIFFINNAKSSIHIASFEFNLPRVADALIAAHERGVDVRWVTDNEYGLAVDVEPDRGQFMRLMASGIQVKDDAGRSALMHNKFWIFDRQTVWTGSTNITASGIYKQNNNVIVIHASDIAYIYEREWEELWAGQLGPRAPSTLNTQWAVLEGTAIQVLFSSEDKAINNLIALVNDAQTSIRFLAFSFTDYPLAQAMIDRAAAGVSVQGVYETFGSSSKNAELKTFLCAQVPVRQDGNSSFLHDKIIVIDNSIVVTGSLNYSSSGDDANEENVIILDNPEIAALYLQEYEKIWNQARDPNLADFPCQ